jgi:hypothetical protein
MWKLLKKEKDYAYCKQCVLLDAIKVKYIDVNVIMPPDLLEHLQRAYEFASKLFADAITNAAFTTIDKIYYVTPPKKELKN